MAKAKTSITTENRSGSAADAAAKEQWTEMPLSDLHPFEGHPFKVLDDELMAQTVESIKQIGVVSPLIVRPDPEGGYEILSGHRRLHAAQLAGLETVPVIVKEMDDDAAIIFMVDSNLQRENILPSERAFSYKMKLEAMKHQGERGDLTSAQVGPKSWAAQVVAEEAGDSKSQVKRYIRLTNLIPEILDMVDSAQESIPFQRMFPDGICRVTDNYYTKTIQFQDINYQLAQQEDQTAIFEEWCSFLNFFDERMFLLTFLVMNTGETEQELETNVFQASSIAQKYNCNLRRLDFQQEQGLMSCLPLAQNLIEIQRSMTTSSTAIFVPFTTQELFQTGKEALYYGLNALSNNLIMVDRKKLKNPNGLILGTPDSGKSFSAKREIANAFLVTDDDVIVCDPEAEYTALVQKFEGQVIKISPSSTQYINPMDINANYSEEDNPIALKADFILSLCELIVGGKEGLQPVEKTVIDRCVHQIYQTYFEHPVPENMPVLQDLYEALLRQDEKEAHHVATALEIYVTGSLNLFNHRTNVDINNRLVCYDIKELGKQLKKIGMLVVQDQVWGRVTANRNAGKATRYYMDEFHLLLKEEQTAAYSVEIWKRFRKWGGIPTGITQNVKDLLSSREVTNIFENSDFIYMLNQAAGDRQILADQLNISPHQLSYVTHSGEGEGLLFYGNVILPFVDRFPTDLELYRIMTTKLTEVQEAKEA